MFYNIPFRILLIIKLTADYTLVVYRYINKYLISFLLSNIIAADLPSGDCAPTRTISRKRPSLAVNDDRDHSAAAPVPIAVERIISAEDFLRWLNARLKREACPDLGSLSRSDCPRSECIVTVHYHGGGGTVRSQEVYDPDNIFMRGADFTPRDHNHLSAGGVRRGTRKVGFFPLGGVRVICLKENPEVPALERAARLLYECLFGEDNADVPNSETILMNGRVFTASSYVEGEGFDEIMKRTEEDAKKTADVSKTPPVFIENLHEIKVFVILTGPEDGRPQNYIWRLVSSVDGHIIFRIFSIDNERILGNSAPHPSRSDAAVIVRGHSIVHCIPEASPDYRNLIRRLKRTPEEVCRSWQAAIRVEQFYHRNLRPYARIPGSTRLSMPITRERVRWVYTTLRSICEGLHRGSNLSEIFMRVNPTLAMVYRTTSIDTPVTAPPVAAPGVVLSDDSTDSPPPQSCLRRAVRRVRGADRGRAGNTTPVSAGCILFGDYFPSQDDLLTLGTEVLVSPLERIGSIKEVEEKDRKKRRKDGEGKDHDEIA